MLTPNKVLILTSEYPPQIGGIGSYTLSLLTLLKSLSIQSEILTSVPAPQSPITTCPKAIHFPSYWNRKGLKLFPFLQYGLKKTKELTPDLLIAMCWTHEGISAAYIKAITGTPYILVAHGSEILRNYENPNVRFLMKKIFFSANIVIVNSHFTLGLVKDLGVPQSRIFWIPPVSLVEKHQDPFDELQTYKQKLGIGNKIILLTTARLTARKGHLLALNAVKELKEKYKNLLYLITGEGDLKQTIQEYVQRHELENHVQMLGFVSSKELNYLYRLAHIYVSPGEEVKKDVEGFGISFIEAAQHRTPSIAGRHGGVPDVIKNKKTGLLLNPVSLNELIDALTQMLDAPDWIATLGNNAYTYAHETFNLEKQQERWKAIFQSEHSH